MINLNKLVAIFVGLILLIGTAMSIEPKQKDNLMTFDAVLSEVQTFYNKEVGYPVRTPIKEFDYDVWGMEQSNAILAYCYLDPNNKYIAFNHPVIERALERGNNPDFVFQIIMHEYVHCEGNVGHIEMFGHFMNDGGYPALSKEEVKDQFKDYLKYYRNFYNKFEPRFKEEEDLNKVHALTISVDADGNIKTSCTCSQCTG